MSKPHTVIVILEAKSGKEAELRSALTAVVKPSQAEQSCLDYRLHTSLENPGQFVLYENWRSKEEHQQQFEKPYIQALGDKLGDLLAKPYQVIFAEQINS